MINKEIDPCRSVTNNYVSLKAGKRQIIPKFAGKQTNKQTHKTTGIELLLVYLSHLQMKGTTRARELQNSSNKWRLSSDSSWHINMNQSGETVSATECPQEGSTSPLPLAGGCEAPRGVDILHLLDWH